MPAAPKKAIPLDRHLLYQIAVQAPAADAALFARWFRRAARRPLLTLREDFCGTAAVACAFVAGGRGRRAIGVDHDAATLAWARQRNLAALPPEARARVQLCCADVRTAKVPRADLIAALNFSYWVFHQRADLLRYLRASRRALRPGGGIVLDVFGGGMAHRTFAERHQHRGFSHVWEQRALDPGTHRIDCRIHFERNDGRRLRNAFTYDWRMWTVPELLDLLREAGFVRTQVLWQDPASGEFRARKRPAPDPHWLAYVTALRE